MSSNEVVDINQIFAKIDAVLELYFRCTGSDHISIHDLRDRYAGMFPRDEPDFVFLCSAVAQHAIRTYYEPGFQTHVIDIGAPYRTWGMSVYIMEASIGPPAPVLPRCQVQSRPHDACRDALMATPSGTQITSQRNPAAPYLPARFCTLARTNMHPMLDRRDQPADNPFHAHSRPFPNSVVTVPQVLVYPFNANIPEIFDGRFTPMASKVQEIALFYRKHIKESCINFIISRNKPVDFPPSLVRTLVEYSYIDLRQLFAEQAVYGTSRNRRLEDADAAKNWAFNSCPQQTPLEIESISAFQNLIGTIRLAYMAAFHPALASIRDYFDHIINLTKRRRGNISLADIERYDQACRLEFSCQPNLTWGDYNARSLKGFGKRFLDTQDPPSSSHDEKPSINSPLRPRTPQASTSSSFPPSKPIKKPCKKPYKKPGKKSYKKRPTAHLAEVDQPCWGWNRGRCTPKSGIPCKRPHGVCDALNCYENHRGRKHHSSY